MTLSKSIAVKYVAVAVGFAMAVSAFAPGLASADTASDLQAQINSLLATIQALQAQLAATTGSSSTGYTFNTNLTIGSTGADVMNLQKVLNMSADTQVASSGVGSPGNETSYFGALTRAAVIKFQNKYGITPAVGYVGPITRAKLNSMNTVVVGPSLPTGGGLSIVAGSQPANSLAPTSAARIPFTTVILTAGASDVTVNSITVERTGLGVDAVFGGVVLLKSDGTQIGIAKTLNSNHQANVGEPFVIPAGTSQTVTIAGNMAASLSAYAGQVVGLNVVAVNTSASVSGSLPIGGAMHTINASLTLGSVTIAASSYDPGTSQSKEIGTTGYKFSGIRVTAGSAEQVKLWSIRWNQSGSASKDDLSNVMVYVDGTAYPTTVSVDGKYYSANFSGGLLIDKGLAKDIYVQGDITGSGSAGRTIKFDLYKTTDLYVSGVTYGYGITPPAGSNSVVTCSTSQACGNFTTGTPWFQANIVTVSAGTVTSIGKATSVAAQNIAVNVPNQVLGGFQTDIKGEPISVQSLAFTIATTGSWTSSTGITSITIVNQNGAVIAGPIDEASTCTTGCTITFTDTITFPLGISTYTIKGKIPTGAPNGATVIVSATPSSGWTSVTGQTTGNTISLSANGAFSMNTMTVKSAALTVTVSATPSAASIVPGGRVTFANYQFDASASGEDVRLGAIPFYYNGSSQSFAADETIMTSCQVYDGATPLNTGSNVVNPSTTVATSTALSQTFTFDQQLTIAKGVVKTLRLECNVASSAHANSQMQWGLLSTSDPTVTGVTSGASVSETLTSNNGQVMTVATGSFTGSVDPSSPAYKLVAGGSTGVTTGVIKFRATNESVNLSKIGLALTAVTAGNSANVAQNLGTVYLYNSSGGLIGTATFTGSNTTATSTLNSTLLLPKDTDVLVTVKADFQDVGTGLTGVEGDLVKIDPTNAEGSGLSSGNTLTVSAITAGVAGVRLFNTFPTIALESLSSTGIGDGRLMRFKVTADSAGDVGIFRFTFTLATTTLAVTNVGLFGYTDSGYSTAMSGNFAVGGTSSGGQIDENLATSTCSNGAVNMTNASSTCASTGSLTTLDFQTASNPVEVPAGQTRYFELRGSIGANATGASVVTKMLADSSAATSTANGTTLATSNFVWSPNATSTAVFSSVDWTTGYGIVGFPTSGLLQSRSY
ncbi:MAG: hypothetical protein A3H52_00365 [Candidatus Zambryskibacteria bacterium RIFCSPLOWO2_02_FULL_39_26]|uniref:Peptidoglycan binding-like domain-containing protein n=1 Tax=Candidatus Zambryskibacteria bacterium RIFCSPLOWO2_12_FULL_39_23 TaxID=1802776 RepID=A0A1G2URZ9_9BACT|nr:MAG: hypothetical protein A2W51_02350 [Candidatus Zambryskibacteria bacterium RIFCSPHIGHO2_02_39_10]OHB09805.1 MAG: hypothetical protein A3H52_00365 [Candidatus Zambryskibacteria bacterium RIFCSPLOWO2_02_FULL_39_26]OHB12177.1 MAG: hypothetical protein A3G99_00895 [Candidatus Zambryskibacteria bacterium RIFCSPLOWO2_12_FULL_39_23]